jgi:phosphoenolpyruvate-protein kinase (PTS system EI component)
MQRRTNVARRVRHGPLAGRVLLGMGVDALSMSSTSLAPIKRVIRTFTAK